MAFNLLFIELLIANYKEVTTLGATHESLDKSTPIVGCSSALQEWTNEQTNFIRHGNINSCRPPAWLLLSISLLLEYR